MGGLEYSKSRVWKLVPGSMKVVKPLRSNSTQPRLAAAKSSSARTSAFQSAKETGSLLDAMVSAKTPRQVWWPMWIWASMKPGWTGAPPASRVRGA